MRKQTLQVPYKVSIPKKINDQIKNILLDEKIIKGWCGVAMGIRYGENFDCIIADAVQKNAKPIEEDSENDEYDYKKLVFLIDERVEISSFLQPSFCAFSQQRSLLIKFCKDFEINPEMILKQSMVQQVM